MRAQRRLQPTLGQVSHLEREQSSLSPGAGASTHKEGAGGAQPREARRAPTGGGTKIGKVAVGDTKTLSIDLSNVGEAKARATGFLDGSAPKAFSTASGDVLVDAGKSGTYGVKFTPDRSGKLTAMLTLVTNDPDERFLKVALSGEGLGGAPVVDAGPSAKDEAGDDGGCGCRVGGRRSASSEWAWLALGAVAFAGRRRSVVRSTRDQR